MAMAVAWSSSISPYTFINATPKRCSAISQAADVPTTTTSSTIRPAVILPGLGNNSNDYEKLALILKGYGVPTAIAKVSRIDWLRNAAGLLDSNYWRGTLRPRPVLDWYLKKIDEAVSEAKELAQDLLACKVLTPSIMYIVVQGMLQSHNQATFVVGGNGTLSFIGHSAGGWLARVYLQEFGFSDVSLLLTLGTPHLPPPKGLPGVIDQTRGLLYYVEEHCAKAVYSPQLRYVCIAGRYIQGSRFLDSSSTYSSEVEASVDQPTSEVAAVSNTNPETASTFRARFVGQGYKQVCGQADVWGDGVVPEVSAHLKGALNITLDGVYHSPVGSDDATRPWYGSPAVVEQWIRHMLV